MRLAPLLPILDAGVLGDSLVAALHRVASGGAEWVEYRDKGSDDATFCRRAAELARVCSERGVALLINDRVDAAAGVGAAGVHLGQEDLPVELARRLLGPGATIGISVDTAEEAAAAEALPVDYIAIGPIFATATKVDAGPLVGLDGLRRVRERIALPLVAIGGIDANSAAEVTAAGADCVAAVSGIFGCSDPEAATRRLIEAAAAGIGARESAD